MEKNKRQQDILVRLAGAALWDSTLTASAKLDPSAHLLRQRLRRAPWTIEGGMRVCRPEGGLVIGVKLGRTWLVSVRLPQSIAEAAE